MQRILPRGEIESLEHTAIPRLRQPESDLYATRAARLRALAADSPVAGYLELMAALADAQQATLKAIADPGLPGASPARIDLAQAHGMPPLQAVGWERDPRWLALLDDILKALQARTDLPEEAVRVCTELRSAIAESAESIEDQADALLSEREVDVNSAAAPFIMGALQVYFTDLARRFDPRQMPVASPFGVCPMCGSMPVASVVRVGGKSEGLRYLCCSLCATQWHLVRVTCSHCESTKDISYQSIEGRSEAIKAEACESCHTYRKIFYQEKDLHVDPVADDLASLMLDVLMGEAGYTRASGNPLLWHGEAEA